MKRIVGLFPNILNSFRESSLLVVTLFLFLSLAFSACNNLSSKFNKVNSGTNVLLSDPATNNTAGSFHIVSVEPDPSNPGTMYNVIGYDQEIESYCSGNFGTCQCQYTYFQPGVGSTTVELPNTYLEADLIRCPTSGVPVGITTFEMKIVTVSGGGAAASPTPATGTTTQSGYYSNSLTVNLATNGAFANSTNYIDLTAAASYVPVQRFQCRKREFIKNPLDTSIIDPFQSSDPKVIYPFNYYTTNVSDSLLQLQRLGNQSWECSLVGTQTGSTPWWANPNVFSLTSCSTSFCSGDQQLMYPTTSLFSGKIPVSNLSATGKRRGSFSLSSQSYGVFQVPVKAAVAPKDYVSGTYSTIGYAAKPIPNVNGSSSCPAIALPLKATWVKLWNFRATDITSPQIVTGSQSIEYSAIACNTQSGDFGSCDATPPNGGVAFGTNLATSGSTMSGGTLASRVAVLASTAGSSSASACYNIDGVSMTGTNESWLPSPYRFPTADAVTFSTMQQFPWNLYAQASSTALACPASGGNLWLDETVAYGGATHGCNTATYAVPSGTPYDTKTQLYTAALAPNNDNYTDQLFVVTDPNVDDTQMRNASSSVSQYTPQTFRSVQDCPGPFKDLCTASPIHWDINVKEVGNPTGTDLYPLCVLQFYD